MYGDVASDPRANREVEEKIGGMWTWMGHGMVNENLG